MTALSIRGMDVGKGLLVFFPALFLFVLPFAHVTALRSIGFLGLLCVAAYLIARDGLPRLPLVLPLSFWLVVALASLLTSRDAGYSFDVLRGDVLYGIATFWGFFLLTRTNRDLQRWQLVTAASMALIGALAIGSYVWHGGVWRYGYHHHIGEYSTFVTTALPLLIASFFRSTLRRRTIVLLAALGMGLGFAGALVAHSRAVWLVAAGLAVLAAGACAYRHPAVRWKILVGATAFCAIAVGAAAYVSDNREISLTSAESRTQIYSFAYGRIAEHPTYGRGFGRDLERDAYRTAFPDHVPARHAHNLLLSYGEQMGIWGIAAALWLFAALFVPFWRAFRSRSAETFVLGVAGLGLLASVWLKNMLDMFFTGHLLLVFWAHAGAMLGYLYWRERAGAGDA